MTMPVADRKFYIMMHNRKDNSGGDARTSQENDSNEKDLEQEKMDMFNRLQNRQ